jgi:hypothetical protein
VLPLKLLDRTFKGWGSAGMSNTEVVVNEVEQKVRNESSIGEMQVKRSLKKQTVGVGIVRSRP